MQTQSVGTSEIIADPFASMDKSNSDCVLFLLDSAGCVMSWNAGAERFTGYKSDEVIGLHVTRFYRVESASDLPPLLQRVSTDGHCEDEGPCRQKNGASFSVTMRMSAQFDRSNELHSFSVELRGTPAEDIHQTALQTSDAFYLKQAHDYREHLAAIVESSHDAIIGKDLNSIVTSWNAGAEALFGYAAQEMIGTSITRLIPNDRQQEETLILEKIRSGERVEQFETRRLTQDGRLIDVSVTASPIRDANGRVIGVSKSARDITLLKESEREIARLTRLYAALSHINQAIVFSPTRDALFQKVCRGLVEHGGFGLVWIERHDPETQTLVPVAHWGGEHDDLQRFSDDRFAARKNSREAFTSGQFNFCNDILNAPATMPWRSEMERRGFRASAVFPISENNNVFGTLSIYSDKRDFFHDKEIALLKEAANDISFALGNFSRDEARRQADQNVRFEKLFSDTMIESTPGIFYFYDSNERFLRWNENFENLTGYSTAEIGQMHPLEFFSDAEKPLIKRRMAEAFEHGESTAEASVVAKNGRAIPHFFTSRRVLFEGKTCLVGVGIDITERLRSEGELRLRDRAIQAVSQGIIITDPNQAIVYASAGFERICGYRSEEVLGKNCRFMQGEDTDPETVTKLREAIAAGRACEVEILNYRKDGKPFWNALSVNPVHDEKGALTHFVGVQNDISERKSLENQLHQSQKMEAMGILSGGVAHDFNNLLSVICGYSEMMLLSPNVTGKIRERIESIDNAGKRAATLTRQLLSFSRQAILQPKVLDLNTVVSETAKMLRRLIGEDVVFTTVLGTKLDHVKVDPGQLDQVLMNLAVNARDAMPKGGKLTVETSNVLIEEELAASHLDCSPGPHVMLAMNDTGCGMTPDVLARIFEPFFTTKGVGKGTGLGLATVFGIVKQSGGCIHVESEPEHGTTFKIYFPAVVEQLSAANTSSTQLKSQGTETILVVEDEPGVRGMILASLEMFGYKVMTATDGKNALSVLKDYDGPLDLVLTDVVMPNMSGPVLAESLRKQFPNVKILFMSGYTDDAVVRHGLLQEKAAFIQKPCTPQGLSLKVRQVLEEKLP